MATASSGPVEVEIGNEKYSLLSVPEAYCSLTQSEREKLASVKNLEKFANSIEHLGNFMKVAYDAANMAGPKLVDIKIEIQRLGFDITRLCNESSVTIDRFRSAAVTISSELVSVYQFLLNGFEDIAILSLASLGKLAEEMTTSANELKEKFKMQQKKVQVTIETIKIKESQQTLENEELKKQEQEKIEYEKLVNKYYALAKKAKEERMKYELKEKKDLAESDEEGSGFLEFISQAILALPWADDKSNRDKQYSLERAKRFEEMAKERVEIELKMEQHHLERLQKMSEFVAKLNHVPKEEELVLVVIEAWHEASNSLHTLSVIMEEAARFWSYIQNHCQTLATTETKETIERYATKDEEKRKSLWDNPEFIKAGVSYHGGWVALRDVCEEYGRKIEATRSGLYSFILENPTYEQSLARLPELTREFTDAIDQGKKSITAKMNEKEQALTECEND